MSKLRVTLLGTGTSQGVPVIACPCDVCASNDPHDKRLRTSCMIEQDGRVFVIDTGPDFRQQMLRERVTNLTAVVFTHEHKDHVAGMDDVRAFNFVLQKRIDIYASPAVQDALKRDFHYAFGEFKYPGVPDLELHTVKNEPFEVQGTTFTPIEVMHYKMPVFGFRVGDFTYITDANYISDAEKAKIKGSKVLVLNALRIQEHISHFTLQEALELVEELQPEHCYLTHISHQLGKHEDVSRGLPDNVSLGYDGLAFEVG